MSRIFLFFLGVFLALPASALTLIDDSGQPVTLARPASRIVSLAPTATELIYAAGAGDQLVGVVSFSDWPEQAAKLPVIGRFDRLDLEAILALKPDLAIAWADGNRPAELRRLEKLGVPVFVLHTRQIPDVARHLRLIGQLANTKATAGQAADTFLRRIAALPAPAADMPRQRVFIELWDRPLTTLAGGGIVDQAITRCGGKNVFAALPGQAPAVSTEAVLAADPQILIATGMTGARADWLIAWQRWPTLSAVREQRLHTLDPDLLFRAGPRLAEGLEALCRIIQP
ncbi:MAG: cobalamin-binding protein [Zoogloeaceae bacterium]|jgi:iron complex transport system substrate-binding protein|nr:cobalamin-binding protein [Zoogloeaceae bacterium]